MATLRTARRHFSDWSPHGAAALRNYKSALQRRTKKETELGRRCMQSGLPEVAVLGSPSLIVLMVSVDVKQHWTWTRETDAHAAGVAVTDLQCQWLTHDTVRTVTAVALIVRRMLSCNGYESGLDIIWIIGSWWYVAQIMTMSVTDRPLTQCLSLRAGGAAESVSSSLH